MKSFIVALLATLGLLVSSTPAEAAKPSLSRDNRIVYVDLRDMGNPQGWDPYRVQAGLNFIDGYTSSRFIYVPGQGCRAGYRCVHILPAPTYGTPCGGQAYLGCTIYYNYDMARIWLTPLILTQSSANRLKIVVHELGHAMGLLVHASTKGSVMYRYATSARLAFTRDEVFVLSLH